MVSDNEDVRNTKPAHYWLCGTCEGIDLLKLFFLGRLEIGLGLDIPMRVSFIIERVSFITERASSTESVLYY